MFKALKIPTFNNSCRIFDLASINGEKDPDLSARENPMGPRCSAYCAMNLEGAPLSAVSKHSCHIGVT